MRSQYIKIRNVPEEIRKKSPAVHVKPWGVLYASMIVNSVLLIVRSYMISVALPLIILTLFAIIIMPDRILVQFTDKYLLLYNRPDRSECTLIYWDEIVSWKYEYHSSADLLVLSLVDGNSETVEMYSKRSIRKAMRQYAKDKEVKRNGSKKTSTAKG